MPNDPRGPPDEIDPLSWPTVGPEFLAASDHAPPAPGQIAARLGLLLAIALGFGLVAHLLVGVHA